MPATKMVSLTTVPTEFGARVLMARLGADGVVCQLRSAVGAPYHLGGTEVLVPADQFSQARELLLVDEVESALEGGWGDDAAAAGPDEDVDALDPPERSPALDAAPGSVPDRRLRWWVPLGLIGLCALVLLLRFATTL